MGRPRRKKGEQRQGRCVYCGKEGPISSDHVFPQSIFLTLDEQMITVPACADCQQTKSLGDRDLRNYIVLDIGGSTHPDAMAIATRMLRESNVRVRNWLRKLLESPKEVDLVTESGIVVGQAVEFEFNMERIMMAQEMVARGLHFHQMGEVLPQDTPIFVEHIPWHVAPNFLRSMSETVKMLPSVKGNDVAWWTSHPISGLADGDAAWVICYNDWVLFLAVTGESATALRERRQTHFAATDGQTEVLAASRRRIVVPADTEGRPILPPSATLDIE